MVDGNPQGDLGECRMGTIGAAKDIATNLQLQKKILAWWMGTNKSSEMVVDVNQQGDLGGSSLVVNGNNWCS